MKKEKGITMIALIITIIILLILAGVSIGLLTGENGIVKKAELAKYKTDQAQVEENEILGDYENIINGYINNSINESTGEIKDFAPKITDIGSHGFTVNAKAYSDNASIICYVYIVNGKLKGAGAEEQCIVTDLDADTDYTIIVVAIDSFGNSKKSEVKIRTKTEFIFTKEFLKQGQTNGSVSITENNLNGTPGLSMTGHSPDPTNNWTIQNSIRWYNTIDLKDYNNLQLYAKKGVNHGSVYIWIDNTEIYRVDYNDLPNDWIKLDIDISEYSGEHIVSIIGGYIDYSGSTSSNTQYCDIRLNYK